MAERISSNKDLRVCQNAMDAAIEVFAVTKSFPPEDYAHYRSCCQMMREARANHALLRKRR